MTFALPTYLAPVDLDGGFFLPGRASRHRMVWAVITKGLLDLAEVTVAAETILETCGYVRLWLLADLRLDCD